MKIVVTGANGYIGKHVVKALLDRKHEVVASDIQLSGLDPRAIPAAGDILDGATDYYEKFGQPDVVIHLAWQDGFAHNAQSHIDSLHRHFNFVKNLTDNGLKQIIVMGSMHEIGYYVGKIDEHTPANPTSYYGIAKNALRQAISVHLSGKDTVFQWLRGFYLVGDDHSNHSVFTKILAMDKEGKTEFPFTDGENQYDFLDINTFANQIASVSEQTDVDGIINCCSGVPCKLKDKISEFLTANHLSIKPAYGQYPARPYDSRLLYGDNQKILSIIQKQNV